MKKIWLFLSLLSCSILLTGCFDKVENEVIDDCIFPEDCAVNEPTEDLSNKYLTAFWTEPFWGIEISWWIAKLSSPMFDTEYEEPVTIWQEWENYYFSWEELEGEFILKDCIDWWKWDMHYYTVWVSKFREYYYEWCGDGEDWIKMSDEDVPADYYQYQPEEDELAMIQIVQDRTANWFNDMETCMHTLDQYQPEWMPWDPQTIITVWCWPVNYGDTIITWYIYTSTHPDLWLRITSPKWYDTFYVKSETPIFVRDWNKITYNNDLEYIRVYEKSADESVFELIENSLNKWCFTQPYEYEWQNKVYGNINNNMIYNIVDKDWNIWSDSCIADNEATEQNYMIVRYFESLDKTKYYKLVFTDWCAPGPCSMFDEVEVF